MNTRNLVILVSLFTLSACGGGAGTTQTANPPVNAAPSVEAGADATIRLPVDSVDLDGTVTDDNLPAGAAVSTAWTVQSGPAGATFADPNSVDTTVTFATEGTYVLELTADDTALTASDTVTVVVEAAPAVASIDVMPASVALSAGAVQQFAATATDQYGDPIAVTPVWTATGGTIDQTGSYTAGAVPGDFEVTATDGAVSGTADVTIAGSPPTADAGGPYAGVEGTPIALDGSASSDPNNDIVSYDWDLDNDGVYDDANGPAPTFAAASSGVFTIGLQVTDADGASNTDTATVTVDNVAPTADAGGPYSGDQGTDIALDASASSDPGNDIVSYAWDLDNDGAYDDATGAMTVFNSPSVGDFTVGVQVTDVDGDSGTATTTVTVNNLAPTADAGGPYSGDQAADIALDGSASSDPGGNIVSYDWDLDNDGAYDDATGVSPNFNSLAVGTFTIGLQVTDGDGDTGTATTTVEVLNVDPTADAGGPYSGDEGADIQLDASGSTDPGNNIVSWEWDYDLDGNHENANGEFPTFNSSLPGVFTVEVLVTDGDGGTDTAQAQITVNDLSPAAPTGLSAIGNDGEVALDWDESTEADLAGYRVYRSTTSGSGYTEISGPDPVNPSSYSDTSVVNATTYYYVVRAVDDDTDGTTELQSANSAEVMVTPNGDVHAYWTMEEGTGGTTADTVGSSDGTLNGPAWTTGASGSGLDFDGVDDYVDIDNTGELRINGTAITLMAWIYPRDGDVDNGARIISKRTSTGGQDVFAMILDDYRMWFRLDGVDLVSSSIIRLNEWQHVAMVYDGTDKRIYVDGVLDGAGPQAKTDAIDSSTQAVQLGWRQNQQRHFDGAMDEVQIFNRALSPGEVATAASIVPPAPATGLKLTDITESAGVDDMPDGGHGVMFADVNGDTLPDLYITNNFENALDNPRPDHFYRNTNGSVFSEEAATAGIDDVDGGSHGAVWADLDNDGDYDLVNGTTWDGANPSRGNPDPDNVYENTGVNSGSFTDVTDPIIATTLIETRGITATDWDDDGDLDIFAVSGNQTPGINEAFANGLIGGTAFSFSAHVGGVLSTAIGMQGVTDSDFDGDGDVDLFAANRGGDFAILVNDGNGTFTQLTPIAAGIDAADADEAGDGITTADIDNDGDLDLLLVSDGTGILYERAGGSYSRLAQFDSIEGYMGGFADLDNDGDLDLVFAGDERTFINDGSGSFSRGQSVPVPEIDDPRAVAFADIDNDGDLDLAIAAKRSRNWLVRNDYDGTNGFLKVQLVSPDDQAGAFGAKVMLYAAGDIGGTLLGMREAKGNYGYLGQDEPVLHFGLGASASVGIRVVFLDGTTVDLDSIAAGSTVLVDASP